MFFNASTDCAHIILAEFLQQASEEEIFPIPPPRIIGGKGGFDINDFYPMIRTLNTRGSPSGFLSRLGDSTTASPFAFIRLVFSWAATLPRNLARKSSVALKDSGIEPQKEGYRFNPRQNLVGT